MNPFTSAVVLAAGASRRFKDNKLLQRVVISGRKLSLIRLLVEKLCSVSELNEVIVVVGYEAERVIEELRDLEVQFIYNKDYLTKGMSSSVKAGVSKALEHADIVLIHPGDVPFISRDTVSTCVKKALELYKDLREFILIARYSGRSGHPVIISSKNLMKEALNISEETLGLKGFIAKNIGKTLYCETNDLGVLFDVDTPGDLAKAEEVFKVKWVH